MESLYLKRGYNMKIIVKPKNLLDLNNYIKKGADAFLFDIRDLSIRNIDAINLPFFKGLRDIIGDKAEVFVVGDRAVAVAAIGGGLDLQTLKLAAVLLALQAVEHLCHQVIDVEQFQFHAGVIDRDGLLRGDIVAEGGYGTVVVGPAPFAEEVGETVDEHLGAGLLGVVEKEFLTSLLASAIF